MYEQELKTAISAARKAAENILAHYERGFEVEQKLGYDEFIEPVTIADREASRLIVDHIAAAFPDDAVLSEEEADDLATRLASERVWIIDPIDGTAGFVEHDGDFAIQIGLAIGGRPVVGVVHQPYHDTLSFAVKGGGSFVSLKSGEPIEMKVSDVNEVRRMSMAMSKHHPSKRLSRIIRELGLRDTVQRGSVGLKVSLIVDRTCDLYISPGGRTKLWDTCAPQIILEEAGGKFTDLFGLELKYDGADLQNRNGLLASNGRAHDAVVKRLAPLLKEFGRVPYARSA